MGQTEKGRLLGTEGTVTMSLQDYNFLRDSLEGLLKTTETQEEFLKRFRLSLTSFIGKCNQEGLEISELYSYFKDFELKQINTLSIDKQEDVWVVEINKQEDEND